MEHKVPYDDMTHEQRKQRFLPASTISREEYDRIREAQNEHQVRAPQPRTEAPDFTVERLGKDASKTGKTVPIRDPRFVIGPCT